MTDFRPKDFAAEVEPRCAVKKVLKGFCIFVAVAVVVYLYVVVNPDTISSFFEQLLAH